MKSTTPPRQIPSRFSETSYRDGRFTGTTE